MLELAQLVAIDVIGWNISLKKLLAVDLYTASKLPNSIFAMLQLKALMYYASGAGVTCIACVTVNRENKHNWGT